MKLISILFLLIVLFFSSCNQSNKTVTKKEKIHHGVTFEILKSNDYTFINFKENSSKSLWVATRFVNTKPQIGLIYFYPEGEMKTEFTVDELNKTFDTIYFVDKISTDPTVFGLDSNQEITISQESIKPTIEDRKVNIDKPKGNITIENLFAHKDAFAGKNISIKGVVTKFNSDIMNKNWIHIQDGTKYQKMFDLTITTDFETAIGDTIIATGEITLDKDFGYGYFYPVLMENAKIN